MPTNLGPYSAKQWHTAKNLYGFSDFLQLDDLAEKVCFNYQRQWAEDGSTTTGGRRKKNSGNHCFLIARTIPAIRITASAMAIKVMRQIDATKSVERNESGWMRKAGNPSFIIPSPDRHFAYAVSEYSDGRQGVYSYALTDDRIVVLNFRGGTGEDPCNIVAVGGIYTFEQSTINMLRKA